MTQNRQQWYKNFALDCTFSPMLHRIRLEQVGIYFLCKGVLHLWGQPYGHLSWQSGIPVPMDELAEIIKIRRDTLINCAQQLVEVGLWGQDPHTGVYFDIILIENMMEHAKAVESGRKGGRPRKPPPFNPTLNLS